jgi:TatD DNase family protein
MDSHSRLADSHCHLADSHCHLADSHCHLADEAFLGDVEAVIARAQDAGLEEALCVVESSDPDEIMRAAGVRALWPRLRTTAGVHPHRAARYAARVTAVRVQIATDAAVRAIGEVGLDYHYDLAPRALQLEVFAAQIALAREVGLPLIVHTREADDDTIDVLRQTGGGGVCGVFHCFSGDVTLARRALDLGFHVSFSGIVTFPKALAIREAAAYVPDDRLLVETDSPYLAPVPRRGTRNEPAWVAHVAACLAGLRGTDVAVLAERLVENYRQLFRP